MSTDSTLSARALASRRNGARSRGPRTAAGKAQSARNALKHGLCAKKLLIVPEEDAAAFEALQAQLRAELAPVGALQAVLAERIVSAAWRLRRADRLEAEVLAFRRDPGGDLGVALIRDGNGTRGFETVLRYRNAAIAEFLRAHKTLQALQAEARTPAGTPLATPARKPAGNPATRRARPRVTRSVGPGKRPETNAPTENASITPEKKQIREGALSQRLDSQVQRRASQGALGSNPQDKAPATCTAPDPRTERTQKRSAKQHLGLSLARRSAA